MILVSKIIFSFRFNVVLLVARTPSCQADSHPRTSFREVLVDSVAGSEESHEMSCFMLQLMRQLIFPHDQFEQVSFPALGMVLARMHRH